MATMKTLLGAALAAAAVAAGVAAAQEAEEHAPPPWSTLARCAGMPAEDARLACYDAAMRAAGFKPNTEAVETEKRKRFGLSFPQVGALKHHDKTAGAQAGGGQAAPGKAEAPPKETEGEVFVELAQVGTLQPNNRLIMFTTDGAIWEQTDGDQVVAPRAGDKIRIHKEVFGGYFCDVNKYKTVRCKRDR
jgi:hypothetical protein